MLLALCGSSCSLLLGHSRYASFTVIANADDEIRREAMEKTLPVIEGVLADLESLTSYSESSVSFPFNGKLSGYEALEEGWQRDLYNEILTKASQKTSFEYLLEGYKTKNYLDWIRYLSNLIRDDYPKIGVYFACEDVLNEAGEVCGVKSVYFCPSDDSTGDIESIEHESEVFEAACDYIVERMPENCSTYDKYRYLAAIVTDTALYDMDAGRMARNAYGAILGGKSVCEGYAKSFQYLCKKADLYCDYITGYTTDTEGNSTYHAWNVIKLEDGTYYVDTTWMDGGDPPVASGMWYQYFAGRSQDWADHISFKDKEDTQEYQTTGSIDYRAITMKSWWYDKWF